MGIPTTINSSSPARPSLEAEALRERALEMYLQSKQGLTIEAEVSRRACAKVTVTLFAVAGLRILGLLLLTVALSAIKDRPIRDLILVSEVIATVVLWALAIWSLRSPLGAAVAALAVFLTFWAAQNTAEYRWLVLTYGVEGAAEHMLPDQGTLLRFGILGLLIHGVYAGIQHRKYALAAEQAQSSPDSPPALPSPRRLAGVTTAILLYLVYLYLPLNVAALNIEGELTDGMYLRHLLGWGIIVGVWSIASWRDVYRTLLKPVHVGWYLGAAAGGAFTYLLATTLMEGLLRGLGMPAAPAQDPTMAMGFSLISALLITAVYPAIFEEIAFRSVIYTGLARWLTTKETILASSLMFMAIHMQPLAFPHLFAIGLILGIMRWKCGSWLPGVLLHFVHNALCVVVPWLSIGR